MVLKIPPITVCPHCGFESEDDEICRACGELTEDNISARNVSLTHILSNNFFSWLKNKGFHGVGMEDIPKDIGEEPSLNPPPGSSWFIHYHDYDKN